eukprot:6210403-Pleurochrysis_carterae.AAC.1
MSLLIIVTSWALTAGKSTTSKEEGNHRYNHTGLGTEEGGAVQVPMFLSKKMRLIRSLSRTATLYRSRRGRHQYGAPLRPWRYESLRGSAVRASRLRIRDRM